jgi:hypothetical protein
MEITMTPKDILYGVSYLLHDRGRNRWPAGLLDYLYNLAVSSKPDLTPIEITAFILDACVCHELKDASSYIPVRVLLNDTAKEWSQING